jgi:hypothetical protein
MEVTQGGRGEGGRLWGKRACGVRVAWVTGIEAGELLLWSWQALGPHSPLTNFHSASSELGSHSGGQLSCPQPSHQDPRAPKTNQLERLGAAVSTSRTRATEPK